MIDTICEKFRKCRISQGNSKWKDNCGNEIRLFLGFKDGLFDQSYVAVSGEVPEKPSCRDEKTVGEADKIENMDRRPSEPCDKTRQLHFTDCSNSFCFADGG